MAQFVDEGSEGQVQDTQFDLKTHLSKYNVPDTVHKLLCDESITVDELTTFTIKDLEDWCIEHSLKTIERRRFVNAVKSLPNAQSNVQPLKEKIVEVPIFLGNEEKEQLSQFDEMKNNVNKMIKHINEIHKKSNANGVHVIQEINKVCDEIQSVVEKVRKTLLQQVYLYLCVDFCFELITTINKYNATHQ